MSENSLMLYIVCSVAIMLLLSLLLVFFLNFSQKKITQTKLQMQAMELALQKELLDNTVKTQEMERDRIAKDLHDEVASKLNIIHLNIHLLKQKYPLSVESAAFLQQIEHSLKASSERVRSISHELIPPMFKKMNIQQVLQQFAESVNDTQIIQFRLENQALLEIKDYFKILHLYRIVQELTNNTLKYATAKNIILKFESTPSEFLQMTYSDDGIGFDAASVKRGQGLSNIETRIRLLDGKLHIESQVGKGVQFNFTFPNHHGTH